MNTGHFKLDKTGMATISALSIVGVVGLVYFVRKNY